MADTPSPRQSTLKLTPDIVLSEPVSPTPFIPKISNLFTKFPSHISPDSWDLWEFDAFNASGLHALGCSLYRDARGLEKGGFHAEINAIWPDGRCWSETLYFTTSEIVQEGAKEQIRGKWSGEGGRIEFVVQEGCEVARLSFHVPGKIEGVLEFQSTSALPPAETFPKSEKEAQLCQLVYYMFPMGPVCASIDAKFIFPTDDESRDLSISNGNGGMVRGWSGRPWPSFMNDAYYVVAHVGPYTLQILRVLGSIFVQHKASAVARLYRDRKLVCAANDILDSTAFLVEEEVQRDSVCVTKVMPDEDVAGLAGKFRDGNVGYTIEFAKAGRKDCWKFDVVHDRAVWSEPTSELGPDGTGKSGWIEAFSGGSDGEKYEGVGFGGQLQIPVP